jgi:uncharacterized protein
VTRRNRFKFRLTQKQKKRLRTFLVLGLCVAGIFALFHHPARHGGPRPKPRPVPFFHFRGHPKIVFVIDDIGGHKKFKTQLASLGPKVTYAILPLLPYSKYFGHLSEKTHAEVILHLPLDTVQDMIPGPGLIVSTMSDEDILELLARDLDSVPNHIGVNNHMGSRGTTDRRVMKLILSELKKRDLFFLDSYTTLGSVVREVGRAVGLPVLTRGVFLDNVDAQPEILGQLHRVEAIARTKGTAIAIGHYRKNTLNILAVEIPRLESKGFEIITLKEMLRIQQD